MILKMELGTAKLLASIIIVSHTRRMTMSTLTPRHEGYIIICQLYNLPIAIRLKRNNISDTFFEQECSHCTPKYTL